MTMPPATGLQFYRKRQTIDQLALERPQSLQIFRECVAKALIAIERRIELLQQSYYGPENNIEQEINKWLVPLSKVLRENRITYFLCKTQLDDAVARFRKSEGDPTMVVDFDKASLAIVIDTVDRVLQYLKTGFADIIKDLKMIGEYMWKYCLSFSGEEGDVYLDTAVNYEKQRKEFYKAVLFNLDDIVNMAEQFETKGMRVQELGFVARDYAERCKATHAPFLVIIPQAFENLRNSVSGLRMWLEADECYVDFIKYDVAELEAKKETQEKQLRDLQVKCSNCEHKLKTAKRLLADVTSEVNSFHTREINLCKEKEVLEKESKEFHSDMDIKVFRKKEMNRRIDDLSDYERNELIQLEKDIEELNEQKPFVEKKIDDVYRKLDVILERKELMWRKEKDVEDAKGTVTTLFSPHYNFFLY